MIKNIIFDIGNVLSDFCWREFLEQKGFSDEMIERISKASVYSETWNELDRGAWTEEEILEAFIRNDPEIKEELLYAFGDIHGMVKLRPYACDWINELKGKGYGVYYLSNFSHKAETECPDSLAFLPLMNGGILSWRDKLIKPDPAIYELLLTRYHLNAEECVFLDDTLRNVEGAKKCGIPAILFQTKEQAVEQLLQLGVDA